MAFRPLHPGQHPPLVGDNYVNEDIIPFAAGWSQTQKCVQQYTQTLEELFEETKAIEDIVKKTHDRIEHFTQTYDIVFNMCIQREPFNWSSKIYDGCVAAIHEYVNKSFVTALERSAAEMEDAKELVNDEKEKINHSSRQGGHSHTNLDDRKREERHCTDRFLIEWTKRWQMAKCFANSMNRIFMYLNRFYIPNSDNDKTSAKENVFRIYKTKIYDVYQLQARRGIVRKLEYLTEEGLNAEMHIEQFKIPECAQVCFREICEGKLYERDFQPHIVQLKLECEMKSLMQSKNIPANNLCNLIVQYAFDMEPDSSTSSNTPACASKISGNLDVAVPGRGRGAGRGHQVHPGVVAYDQPYDADLPDETIAPHGWNPGRGIFHTPVQQHYRHMTKDQLRAARMRAVTTEFREDEEEGDYEARRQRVQARQRALFQMWQQERLDEMDEGIGVPGGGPISLGGGATALHPQDVDLEVENIINAVPVQNAGEEEEFEDFFHRVPPPVRDMQFVPRIARPETFLTVDENLGTERDVGSEVNHEVVVSNEEAPPPLEEVPGNFEDETDVGFLHIGEDADVSLLPRDVFLSIYDNDAFERMRGMNEGQRMMLLYKLLHRSQKRRNPWKDDKDSDRPPPPPDAGAGGLG